MSSDEQVVRTAATEYDTGVTLPEIWRRLLARKGWILGVTAVFVAGALIYVALAPREWEANAFVQIGQVAITGPIESNVPIEPPYRALARLKLAPFAQEVLKNLGISPGSREAVLYERSLNPKIPANTDVLELTLRAYSREEAQRWAEATVAQLAKVHETLARPAKDRLKTSLDEVNRNLEKLQSERAALADNKQLRQQVPPGTRFAEHVVYANAVSNVEKLIMDLDIEKRILENKLSPARTHPTALMDRVYVPESPSVPRKSLIIGVAAMIGLILGCLAALVADEISRSRPGPGLSA